MTKPDMHTIVRSSTRAAEVAAVLDAEDVQLVARVSFVAADPDRKAGRLDAVAGSEFVDDRIRLLE